MPRHIWDQLQKSFMAYITWFSLPGKPRKIIFLFTFDVGLDLEPKRKFKNSMCSVCLHDKRNIKLKNLFSQGLEKGNKKIQKFYRPIEPTLEILECYRTFFVHFVKVGKTMYKVTWKHHPGKECNNLYFVLLMSAAKNGSKMQLK